jgi:bacterioferritin
MAFFSAYDVATPLGACAVLNHLYASEVIAREQYYRHAVDVTGLWSTSLQGMFEEHAAEEQGHADTLRDLIDNLGGTITNELSTMVRANPTHSGNGDVSSSPNTKTILQQDLEAETTAIEAYAEAARMFQTTQYHHVYVALAEILGDEYHHQRELRNLLAGL